MKKTIAVLLAMIMLLAMFAGCGKKDDVKDAPGNNDVPGNNEVDNNVDVENVDKDKYRELTIGATGTSGWVGCFDPTGLASDSYNSAAILLMYDAIFYVDAESGEWTSDILESWKFDAAAPALTMNLKDNVMFSNGDQMTCEDILWTLQRVRMFPRTASYFQWMLIDEATISDDGLTIVIPFSSDCGIYQSYLSAYAVLNKSWIEENGGENFDWTDPAMVCGSGPYKVTDYEDNLSTAFELRDDYWMMDQRQGAFYNKITVYFYADETTMMVDYETGELNVAVGMSSNNYARVKEDGLGTAATIRSNMVATILMNIEDVPEMADINLRKAIIYGTDTKTIAKIAYGELWNEAKGFVSDGSAFFVDGYAYEYDPDLAKKIVEENGLAGTTLNFVVSTPDAKIAEAFQSNMKEIGITVNLDVKDMGACMAIWREPGSTAFQIDGNFAANVSGDASNQYGNQVSTKDFSAMRRDDEAWNALVNGAQLNSNPEIRADYFADLQKANYENYSSLPIAEWLKAYCYDDSVAICRLNSTTGPDLRNIYPAE